MTKTWTTHTGTVIQRLLSGRCNVFLVRQGDAAILVDTSWKRARRVLQKRLDGQGFHEDRHLTAVLLTHTHFDHAGSAAFVHQRYGTQLIVQRCEADCLRAGVNPALRGTVFLTRWLTPQIGARLGSFLGYEPAEPDILVDERLDLRPLGIDAELIHTPGHSPGSTTMIVGGEVAIAGDALYGVIPGSAFPPYAADAVQLVKSWETLLECGCRVFLPAHGGPVLRDVLARDFLRRRN